jgi:hypothetical protein
LNEQELEDKIWENSGVPISKTDLWRLVKGDKKTCFDKIDEMVQTSQLKEIPEGNKKLYVRLDSIKKVEFEFGFEFQKRMLELSRSVIKKMKYPMFKRIGIYKTSRFVHLGFDSKTVIDIDKKGEYKPRNKVIQTNFENMSFYYGALLLFISRTNLQRSLGVLTKPEADRRNKKCENALSEHFKKLQSENRRESKAIKQYFLHKIYKTENFRI